MTKNRDVRGISNLGGTTLRGNFFLKKKGHFLKMKRAPFCLLQNLGGTSHLSLLCWNFSDQKNREKILEKLFYSNKILQ